MKALKITFSGSYKSSNDDIFSFEGVDVIVPYQEYDIAVMHAKTRHLPMALAQSAKRGKGEMNLKIVKHVRDKYDDASEVIEDHKFDFEGKDIKEMTFEDIQDVALMFDLREIPKFRQGSLRHQQAALYGTYSTKILNEPVNEKEEYFSLVDMPPIVVGERPKAKRDVKPIFSDDAPAVAERTLDSLKREADQKGLEYHPRIGYDALYAKLNAVA